MNAGALKEIRYLEKHGRPLLPFNRFQRETFDFQEQDPAVHLDSLQKYLQIAKHLIPPVAALTPPKSQTSGSPTEQYFCLQRF